MLNNLPKVVFLLSLVLFLFLAPNTYAQDATVPSCSDFGVDSLRPDKVVASTDQCNGEVTICHTPLVGDVILCDVSEEISGPARTGDCDEPNPNDLKVADPVGSTNCPAGYESCNISGLSIPQCQRIQASSSSDPEDSSPIRFLSFMGAPARTAAVPPGAPAPTSDQGPGPSGIKQLQEMLTRGINLSVALAFIALTIVLFYSGIKFLTSGGEPKALASASQAITWALLGILFLAIAWLILKLIATFTGVDVTHFNLCTFFPGGNCP